jgi:hypothetical protein
MTDIAKSDLFFMITSVSVVVLTIIIAVVLIYAFFIIRNLKTDGNVIRGVTGVLGLLKNTFFGRKKGTKKK